MRHYHWCCFVLVAALAWFGQPSARAVATTPITACGTISQSGSYFVPADITTLSPSSCIVVAAEDVSITFASGAHLIGPGTNSTGAGIHILKSGSECVVLFARIGGFREGIEDEGSQAKLIDLGAAGNWAGVSFENVKDSKLINVTAIGGTYGVYATNSQRIVIADSGATGGTYGIWLKGTSDSQITDSSAFTPSGGAAGIYFGPSANGNFGHGNDDPGARNHVDDSGGGSTTSTSTYGIVIDKGEKDNLVASSSGFGTTFGLADFNANCDDNQWLTDSGTRNQACIN
jgi:hypothetical protein